MYEGSDTSKRRARYYFRCPECGEPQLVETTEWPAKGLARRYRVCLNGHEGVMTEERIKPKRVKAGAK